MSSSDDVDARQLKRGLPAGRLRGRRLVFEAHSGALLLGCRPDGPELILPQLFVQFAGDPNYVSATQLLREQLMPATGPNLMVESWTVAPGFLFCIIGEPDTSGDTRAKPVVDRGLAIVDLIKRDCSVWDTRQIGSESCLVTELLGTDPTGDCIYAIVGFPTATRLGPVSYALACLRRSSRTIERVREMGRRFVLERSVAC